MPARASRSPHSAWKKTWLWETLQKRAKELGNNHASEFLPALELWMRDLDTVLQSGGTSPPDFTLHDSGHAFRVAHRMAELITHAIRQNLSDYELALLLLAAYGHDIGMTPERQKVQNHHRHLLHPAESALTDEEKQRFQKFLDEWPDRPVNPPLSNTPAGHCLADELTAFYVRERHNDWSADWLRENLKTRNFGALPDVVSILIRLCSSHHDGFEILARRDFDPFLTTGVQPQLIHLRYLACILRLADILENDPGRTPAILYRHRDIASHGKSLVHWQKDHALTIVLLDDHLHFQARPRNAQIHKALEQLADWINHELHGIANFGDRLPVHKTVGEKPIERRWHLAPALTRDIRPFDDSYEYIQGAFRPDTARLLQLFSGEQLYGSPLVAVRELLQNAFDAVREKIARIRLDHPAPDIAHRKWETTLGDNERVTLTLRPAPGGGYLLTCEDTGVGITRAIISDHLLVSGHTRRHSLIDLERRCLEKGFLLGRTGQFGIGVLSYFMLADKVEITTTRSQACGDPDGPGWTFTTCGVDSFGELRKLPAAPFPHGGTRIQWKLRPAQVSDPAKFASDLLNYLKETLIRIPCRFEFKTEGIPGTQTPWQRSTGWVKTEEDWMRTFRDQIDKLNRTRSQSFEIQVDYLSDERAKKELEDDSKFQSVKQLALSTLRCEFMEFHLPNEAGHARYVLVYHDLADGRCACPRPDVFKDDHEESSYLSGILVRHFTVTSWKGMRCLINPQMLIETQSFHLKVASVEMDIENVDLSLMSISRKGVNLPSNVIVPWEKFVGTATETWIDQFLSSGASDQLHEVNLSLQERPLSLSKEAKWFHFDGEASFRALQHPLALPITHFGMTYKCNHGRSARLADSCATPVAIIVGGQDRSRIRNDSELRFIQSPEPSRQIPCLYWPTEANRQESAFKRFPSEWDSVGIIRVASRQVSILSDDNSLLLLNQLHPMISLMSKNEDAALKLFKYHSSSICQELDDAKNPLPATIALCRLALNSAYSVPAEWETYLSRRSEHFHQLWMLISKETNLPIDTLRLVATDGRNEVEVNPSGLFRRSELNQDASLLPRVTDPNFLLHIVSAS